MARQAIVQVAVARKGGGKTYITANQIIASYITPTTKWKGRQVLIYDVNGEYTDKHCAEKLKVKWTARPIKLEELAAWMASGKKEVRRVLPLDNTGNFTQDLDKMVEILRVILKTFRNGLLLLEDINAYLIDVSSKDVISAITRNRQKNLDILIHYQSFRAIPPRIWANLNICRFHKTNENISTVESKINNKELFYVAQALVNYKFKNDIRFFCYVDNEMDKISGRFSRTDFRIAALNYLKENNPPSYKAAQNRWGKGSENAKKSCINIMERDYYGN